jgi:cystinosin
MVAVDLTAGLGVLSWILGWSYFFAWSASFWPQCYVNWKRKSVEGLSFEYLWLNLTGHCCYLFYNFTLYFNILGAKTQYLSHYHVDVIPVHANDVAFSVHAVIFCALTIYQTFIYHRGIQKMSWYGIGGVILLWVSVGIAGILTVSKFISLLMLLNWCGIVKIIVTLSKYAPQVVQNWYRSSTIGFSIVAIMFDLAGGILSLGQQGVDCVIALSISPFLGDTTKLGLAVFTIFFDLIFLFQHYVLYRNREDPALVL